MNCKEFADFLMAYLGRELEGPRRARFDEHLEECEDCVHYLDTYRETIRLGRLCREPEGPLPEDVPDDLVRAVLAARGSGS